MALRAMCVSICDAYTELHLEYRRAYREFTEEQQIDKFNLTATLRQIIITVIAVSANSPMSDKNSSLIIRIFDHNYASSAGSK